jgi:hypothetical protein
LGSTGEVSLPLYCSSQLPFAGCAKHSNRRNRSLQIENPWSTLKKSKGEYIADCDKEAIQYFKQKLQGDYELKLGAMPSPYNGNPKKARIYLLNGNPGYDTDENMFAFDKKFKNSIIIPNYKHEIKDRPFADFKDELKDTGGAKWWSGSLKWLIEKAGIDKVSNYVFCAEFFPYHSISWKNLNKTLPSQEYTFKLVREGMKRNVKIILMRFARPWFKAIPELETYKNLLRTKNQRRVYISPGNIADNRFDELVKALKK